MRARASVGDEPPRSIDALDEHGIVSEPLLGLEDASVVFADYDLLIHDFPWLGPNRGSALDRRSIDAWLLRNAALTSRPQAAQHKANTPIATNGRVESGHRPPRYGRAAVVEVAPAKWETGAGRGLLDIKGVGVRDHMPVVPGPHTDGLCRLDHTLCEVAFQRLIDAVFAHAAVGVSTVSLYAVIDPGFDSVGPGGTHAAAMIVRRAHRRHSHGVELPLYGSAEHLAYSAIELLLRRYGISSTSPSTMVRISRDAAGSGHVTAGGQTVDGVGPELFERLWALSGAGRWPTCEGINIQTTRSVSWEPFEATLVDFGHYVVQPAFDAPLLSLVRDRPVAWGGVIRPDHPNFVRPHPIYGASDELWGRHRIDRDVALRTATSPDLVVKRPMELAISLAYRWRAGELSGGDIDRALDEHITRTTARWT